MKKETKIMENGLEYQKEGAYWIPVVDFPDQPEGSVGKFGTMRRDFMKKYLQGKYQNLVMEGGLKQYLMDFDQECWKRIDQIMESLKKSQGITEELKAKDQLKWVGMMNNAQHSAEEIVMNEIMHK